MTGCKPQVGETSQSACLPVFILLDLSQSQGIVVLLLVGCKKFTMPSWPTMSTLTDGTTFAKSLGIPLYPGYYTSEDRTEKGLQSRPIKQDLG